MFWCCFSLVAADPVPAIRSKIGAGDLASAEAILEDHRLSTGQNMEYWNGLSWLARGALNFHQEKQALEWARAIEAKADWKDAAWNTPLGAAIEVESKALASKNRKQAVAYLDEQLIRAKGHAIEARLWKNYNQLTLIGRPAPVIPGVMFDQPTLVFLWAHWCGDCKAQSATLTRVMKKHPNLRLLAPTRTYADHQGNAEEEKKEQASIEKVWGDIYKDLPVKPIVDRETMIRYGVSSTPTFVTIDSKGRVLSYDATRLTEARLEALIQAVSSK